MSIKLYLLMPILLTAMVAPGCHRSRSPESTTSAPIFCLPGSKPRVSPPSKQPRQVVESFRSTLISRLVAKTKTAQSPTDLSQAFQGALLDSLSKHPLPRTQAMESVADLVWRDHLPCGPMQCATILGADGKGIADIFETLRLEQLRQLESAPSSERPAILRRLGMLADDAVAQDGAPFEKALIVGRQAPQIREISDQQVADLSKSQLEEMDLGTIRTYCLTLDWCSAIRAFSAVPAPGSQEVRYPSADLESVKTRPIMKQLTEILLGAMKRMPDAKGTVYRSVRNAPAELLRDLRVRAAKQDTTGLYFYGQGAITSSTRSRDIANRWFTDEFVQEESDSSAGEHGSLLLVIHQKSGKSIERHIGNDEDGALFLVIKEILLPPVTSYRVVRFEDRSRPGLTERDPRWPNATHVAHLVEE